MIPLGKIVTALRNANEWTLQELAANVRRSGAPNVKHQHIQQLESRPHTAPRYVVALAAAFGKSVEDLHRWQPGLPTWGPNQPTGIAEQGATYVVQPGQLIDKEESALIDDYRSCSAAVQLAIRTLAAASRKNSKRSAKPMLSANNP